MLVRLPPPPLLPGAGAQDDDRPGVPAEGRGGPHGCAEKVSSGWLFCHGQLTDCHSELIDCTVIVS